MVAGRGPQAPGIRKSGGPGLGDRRLLFGAVVDGTGYSSASSPSGSPLGRIDFRPSKFSGLRTLSTRP